MAPLQLGSIKGAFDGDKNLLFQKIVDRRVIQVADVVSLDYTQHTFNHQYIADYTITIFTRKLGQNKGACFMDFMRHVKQSVDMARATEDLIPLADRVDKALSEAAAVEMPEEGYGGL